MGSARGGLHYKDSEKLMLRTHQIQIKKEDRQHVLKAVALGEKLDPNRHPTRADVKAVTLHHFQLLRTDRGWKTQIILDIQFNPLKNYYSTFS
jgi:SHS2 domain-containing protein